MPLVMPPCYETQEATDNFNNLLHLWGMDGKPDQDWQFIVEDSERVVEFCDLYESSPLDAETKFALMILIVSGQCLARGHNDKPKRWYLCAH